MYLGVLGELLLVGDEGTPVRIGGPKPRQLLTVLAARANRPVTSDVLIDAIWQDQAPDSAEQTLRSYVSRLRKTIGPESLVTRSGGYVLRVADDDLDAAVFERRLAEAVAHREQEALTASLENFEAGLRLWRGVPYLDDSHDAVVLAERSRLEELQRIAVESALDIAVSLGRWQDAIPRLETAVADEPFREERWRLLMLALYRSGRQAEALRTFAKAAEILGEELGIEPSAPLKELEERILLQDPELDGPPPIDGAQLPTRSASRPDVDSGLIGRQVDIDEIDALLASSRLVTITGPGGIGKTSLAVHLASQLDGAFDGGSCFVELGKVSDPSMIEDTVLAVVREHHPRGASTDPWLDLATDMLLVLDNCEHLVESVAASVSEWLSRSGVTILVTSQEALAIEPERVWRLTALRVPPTGEPANAEALSNYDAVQWFEACARRAVPGFAVTSDNADDIASICRALDGIPLALELAAGRLGLMTTGQLRSSLDNRFEVLATRSRSVPTRQRTLDASLRWSYELLSPDERSLFEQASVFQGPFGLEAVAEVCDLNAPIIDIVDGLVSKNVLQPNHGHEATSFSMLESMRMFAGRVRDEQRTDINALLERHARYVSRFATDTWDELSNSEPETAIAGLTRALPDLRAALSHLLDIDPSEALRLVASIGRFWRGSGLVEEGATWTSKVLIASDRQDPNWASAASTLGALFVVQGDLASALDWLTKAQRTAEEAGDLQTLGRASNNLGVLAAEQRSFGLAVEHYARALEAYTAVGDRHGELSVLGNLGVVEFERGDFASAFETAVKHLALSRQVGDRRQEARALINIGTTYFAQEDSTNGEEYLRKAVEQAERGSLWDLLAPGLQNLAEICAADGRYEEAEELSRRALDLALSARFGTASHALATLAEVAAHRQDDIEAAYLGRLSTRFLTHDSTLPGHALDKRIQKMDASRTRLGGAFDAIEAAAASAPRSVLELIAKEPPSAWLPLPSQIQTLAGGVESS